VEIHKKFSLPFACILFVLLGTSLGILAKKGGFVVGISLSFGFFLMYYLFMIGGKDMAIRNLVTPAIGLWTPNAILLIISLYLTFYTIRERTPLRINWPELNIRKFLKRKK
jgi:lipopolysaccharide export system permease protein